MNTNSSAIDRVPQQPVQTGELMPSQPTEPPSQIITLPSLAASMSFAEGFR